MYISLASRQQNTKSFFHDVVKQQNYYFHYCYNQSYFYVIQNKQINESDFACSN